MVSFRHYQELRHNHSHYCPSCQVDLVKESEDLDNTDAEEYSCPTEPCPVIVCYCNGTADSYSVTITEMFRCVEDIISYFDIDVIEALEPPEDIYQLGTELRTFIDSHLEDIPIEDEIAVEQRFETFARLERTLERRDYSDYLQHAETGERVVDFHGVYALASDVLVYTVITDEFDEPRMIRYPKAYVEYIDEENVTSFKQNLDERFKSYFDSDVKARHVVN